MKDLTIGICFNFKQQYYPTKRHRKTVTRNMVTVRDINVHHIDEKDFPVAIKVTDFDILKHDFTSDESKYDTLEYRWDGKDLYQEPRSISGHDKGELTFASSDAFIEALRCHSATKTYECYIEPGKEYQEGISVVECDDLYERVKELQNHADHYVICNGKVWKKCRQPYYKVMTFGFSGCGTGFFINWTYDEQIEKDFFLATQRDLAIKDYHDTAARHHDKDDEGDVPERTIEILIPESYTLKRNLESHEYKGYMWDDESSCYIKKYGKKPAHFNEYRVYFRHDYSDKCCAVVYTDLKKANTYLQDVWQVLGRVLMDVKKVSFEDVTDIVDASTGKSILKMLDETASFEEMEEPAV